MKPLGRPQAKKKSPARRGASLERSPNFRPILSLPGDIVRGVKSSRHRGVLYGLPLLNPLIFHMAGFAAMVEKRPYVTQYLRMSFAKQLRKLTASRGRAAHCSGRSPLFRASTVGNEGICSDSGQIR